MTIRPQRQMWIGSTARTERVSLGRGWQVRLSLKPWRSKVPVVWSAPVVGRRSASEQEMLLARASTPGWPDEDEPGYAEAFVLEFADGSAWVAPQGVKLTLQRMRTPARQREMSEWRFT